MIVNKLDEHFVQLAFGCDGVEHMPRLQIGQPRRAAGQSEGIGLPQRGIGNRVMDQFRGELFVEVGGRTNRPDPIEHAINQVRRRTVPDPIEQHVRPHRIGGTGGRGYREKSGTGKIRRQRRG